jgi:flagellar hook-length control protein FliK
MAELLTSISLESTANVGAAQPSAPFNAEVNGQDNHFSQALDQAVQDQSRASTPVSSTINQKDGAVEAKFVVEPKSSTPETVDPKSVGMDVKPFLGSDLTTVIEPNVSERVVSPPSPTFQAIELQDHKIQSKEQNPDVIQEFTSRSQEIVDLLIQVKHQPVFGGTTKEAKSLEASSVVEEMVIPKPLLSSSKEVQVSSSKEVQVSDGEAEIHRSDVQNNTVNDPASTQNVALDQILLAMSGNAYVPYKPVIQVNPQESQAVRSTESSSYEMKQTIGPNPVALSANDYSLPMNDSATLVKKDSMPKLAASDILVNQPVPDSLKKMLDQLNLQKNTQDSSPWISTPTTNVHDVVNQTTFNTDPESDSNLFSNKKPTDFLSNDISHTATQGIGSVAQFSEQIKQVHVATQETITPTFTQLDTPLHSPNWGSALSQRVTWMIKDAIQNANITINPPNLGPIEVRIQTDALQQTSVQFFSNHAEVRQALSDHLPTLRTMMSQNGLQLGQADVGSGGQFNQQHQQSSAHARKQSQAFQSQTIGFAESYEGVGLINTFA